MGAGSFAGLQIADFVVDEAAVPEGLVEVPAEAGNTIEKSEFYEVTNTEVGEGAEVGREAVVLCLAGVLECAGESLLSFALSIATMLLFPPFKRV